MMNETSILVKILILGRSSLYAIAYILALGSQFLTLNSASAQQKSLQLGGLDFVAIEFDTSNGEKSKMLVCKHEVSQFQFDALEYYFSKGRLPVDLTIQYQQNYPVVGVSVLDAMEFCNALSKHFSLDPVYDIRFGNRADIKGTARVRPSARGFRMLSGNEWTAMSEFVLDKIISTGEQTLERYANFASYGTLVPRSGSGNPTVRNKKADLLPVGSFAPDPLGLFDLHGNAHEICITTFLSDTNDSEEFAREWDYELLGGSWLESPRDRSGVAPRRLNRSELIPTSDDYRTGFRVCICIDASAVSEALEIASLPEFFETVKVKPLNRSPYAKSSYSFFGR